MQQFTYAVPLSQKLYMRGVLYTLRKSWVFLAGIALLAAIYSALFHPVTGLITLVVVAGITWAINIQKYRQIHKKLGTPEQRYHFEKEGLIIETKGLGTLHLLRSHASLYKIYSDAIYFDYRRTNGVCIFLPQDIKERDRALRRLQKLAWLDDLTETKALTI